MSSVNSVNLGNVNRTETDVRSNGVETGKPSFDEKKIKELQNSLSVNLTMLSKKRAVAAGSVFTSNMAGKTSFGSKVKQFFENIKLKFWDASKSISEDCAKLENLLAEGVTASLRGGKSVTREIGDLENKINKFLKKERLVPDNCIEPLKSYPRNHDRLSALKTRVEELHKFSEFADKLNNFHLPYEEENFNADDKKTQHDLAESLKQFHQMKRHFEDDLRPQCSATQEESFTLKIQDIEDRILGKQMVVNFYNTLDLDSLSDDALVKKCASAVEKMKSAEGLLNKAEDLLAKDSDIKYQPFGEYFKSRWLPAEVSQKRSALGLRLNRIAYPEDMERAVKQHLNEVEQHLKRVEQDLKEAEQAGKKRDDYIEDDDYFDYEGFYNRDPFEEKDAIEVEVSQQGEAGKQARTVSEFANIPYIADGKVEEEQQEELKDNSFDIRNYYHRTIPEDDAEVVFANENPAVPKNYA